MGERFRLRAHPAAFKPIALALLSCSGLSLISPLWAQDTPTVNPAEPSESPTATAAHAANAAGEDANTANNPLTIIPGFQVQNYYQPELKDAPGSGATQPILRAIIPVEAFGGSNLLRLSLPVGTTTWGEGGTTSGIGDLTIFNVRVFPLSPSAGFGVGPLLVAPTASAPELGLQKWQIGAQSTFSSHFKWGLLAALVSY